MLLKPPVLATVGVATAAVTDLIVADPVWSIVGIVATGAVTFFLGRASNQKLIAESKRTEQETNALLLQNVRELLEMKKREADDYRAALEAARAESEKLREEIRRLEGRIESLTKVVESLQHHNSRLTAVLSQRLRNLFEPETDDSIPLLIEPINVEQSTPPQLTEASATDSGEAVIANEDDIENEH